MDGSLEDSSEPWQVNPLLKRTGGAADSLVWVLAREYGRSLSNRPN